MWIGKNKVPFRILPQIFSNRYAFFQFFCEIFAGFIRACGGPAFTLNFCVLCLIGGSPEIFRFFCLKHLRALPVRMAPNDA